MKPPNKSKFEVGDAVKLTKEAIHYHGTCFPAHPPHSPLPARVIAKKAQGNWNPNKPVAWAYCVEAICAGGFFYSGFISEVDLVACNVSDVPALLAQ